MEFKTFDIAGPVIIIPNKISDGRGFFMETFKENWFKANISDVDFVQDNQSLSVEKGTIRGLHYQKKPFGQGKLVRVLKGAIFDVAVDIRLESKTFGKWLGVNLTAEGAEQLWIPDGFLHGFCTLEDDCEVFYKVTSAYEKSADAGVAFDDADIGIEWPIDVAKAILSAKDRKQPNFLSLR